MPYNSLIEKIHSHLSLLKEEGETHIQISKKKQTPFQKKENSQQTTPSKPTKTSVPPPTGSPLAIYTAHRVEECGGPQDTTRLIWIGPPQEFEGAHADLLTKMLHAMGYTLSKTSTPWLSDADTPSPAAATLTLGQETLDRATGKRQSLAMVRGKPTPTATGKRITPTFAPSYLTQTPAAKKAVWKDMLTLLQRENLDLPPWSKKFKK